MRYPEKCSLPEPIKFCYPEKIHCVRCEPFIVWRCVDQEWIRKECPEEHDECPKCHKEHRECCEHKHRERCEDEHRDCCDDDRQKECEERWKRSLWWDA